MRFIRTFSLAPTYLSLRPSSERRRFSPLGNMKRFGNGAGEGHSGRRRGSRPSSDSTLLPKEAGNSQMYLKGQPVSNSTYERCPQSSIDREGSVSEQGQSVSMVDSSYDEQFPPLGGHGSSGSKYRNPSKRGFRADVRSKEIVQNASSSQFKDSSVESSTSQPDESSLPSQFGKKRIPVNAMSNVSSGSKIKQLAKRRVWLDLKSEERPYNNVSTYQCESSPVDNSTRQQYVHSVPSQFGKGERWKAADDNGDAGFHVVKPFDICLKRHKRFSSVKSHVQFEDGGHSMEEDTNRILRPGMVLLKHYLSISEQVEIVKNCRKLGLGPGGFYQPGYKDGAKLRLQMMCLGLDWDPQTRKYQKQRSVDGCEPHGIPHKFVQLVKRAIQDAHALIIKEDSEVSNVEDILPAMCPDICIVNFYTTTGRLGLHQDRDESRESLRKGLPVVSFSIGDSAEFLYGDERDIDKAEEVMLDSGDVLIFGGESRHVFHGVPCIISNSAPEDLLREVRLCPGRLNLTFRKF